MRADRWISSMISSLTCAIWRIHQPGSSRSWMKAQWQVRPPLRLIASKLEHLRPFYTVLVAELPQGNSATGDGITRIGNGITRLRP